MEDLIQGCIWLFENLSKISDLSHRHAPMHPILVPSRIGFHFALHHKVLTRTTFAGNVAVLCVVEIFSGFPHFICVPDFIAHTTARTLVDHGIPSWGIPEQLIMDKSSSFTAALFKLVAVMLGIHHSGRSMQSFEQTS